MEKGFIILKGAFNPRDLSQLAAGVEAEFERLQKKSHHLSEQSQKCLRRGEMPAEDGRAPFRLEPENYLHLTTSLDLKKSLLTAIGGDFLWHFPGMFRQIGPGVPSSLVPFHQDCSYNRAYRGMVTVWIPLRLSQESLGLEIINQKFHQELTHQSGSDWEQELNAPSNAPILCPVLELGDAIVFDEYCLHRTEFNPEKRAARLSMDVRAMPVQNITPQLQLRRRYLDNSTPKFYSFPI